MILWLRSSSWPSHVKCSSWTNFEDAGVIHGIHGVPWCRCLAADVFSCRVDKAGEVASRGSRRCSARAMVLRPGQTRNNTPCAHMRARCTSPWPKTQTLRYSVSMLFCFTVKAKAFCIFTQKIQNSRFRDVEQVLISVALVLDCTRVSIPDLSSAFWCVCSCLVTCSLWLMHSFGRSFVSSFQSGVPSTKRRAKNHRRCSAHRNTAWAQKASQLEIIRVHAICIQKRSHATLSAIELPQNLYYKPLRLYHIMYILVGQSGFLCIHRYDSLCLAKCLQSISSRQPWQNNGSRYKKTVWNPWSHNCHHVTSSVLICVSRALKATGRRVLHVITQY